MNYKDLAIKILIPLAVGIIVSLIIGPFIDYKGLDKPPLSPPSIAFPIVWTILYILMGISAYLVDRDGRLSNVYYVQLGVNAFWSIFFFVFKIRLFSFFWLILLIVLVIKMILSFKEVNKKAAYIQIPYLVWCIFAAYLNLGVYLLN